MCQTTESACRFYIIWCIVLGIIGVFSNSAGLALVIQTLKLFDEFSEASMVLKGSKATFTFAAVAIGFGLLLSVLYIIAGILLGLGMSKGSRGLFQAGKIMSYFFPIYFVLGLLPPIIHVVCAKKLSEYSSSRWSS